MDKKDELIENARISVQNQKDRIENGEVIIEHGNERDGKVIVTKNVLLDENKNEVFYYGYMIFDPYADKPFCYIESTELFTDFEKTTSLEGNALPYSGYQSVITRNLSGVFTEYVKNFNFDMYNVYFKSDSNSPQKLTSSVHGFMHKTDPVQLLFIDFNSRDISTVAGVHINNEGKVSVDRGNINEDGQIDVEEMINGVLDEINMEALFTGEFGNLSLARRREKAEEIVKDRMNNLPIALGETSMNILIEAGLKGRKIDQDQVNDAKEHNRDNKGEQTIDEK